MIDAVRQTYSENLFAGRQVLVTGGTSGIGFACARVFFPARHATSVRAAIRIVFGQTFGDLVNFNPHLHVLAADGAFLPGGRFVALPPVPESLLAEGFRRAVLDFLVKNGALSEELRARMLAWRHGGFSVHNEVSVAAEDAEGRKKLAGYRLRAPLSVQKMTYDAATGTVIYRAKMHAGLKRNFQVMPGAEWLALLYKHIPDRYEHLVRYVGWYSNGLSPICMKLDWRPIHWSAPSAGDRCGSSP